MTSKYDLVASHYFKQEAFFKGTQTSQHRSPLTPGVGPEVNCQGLSEFFFPAVLCWLLSGGSNPLVTECFLLGENLMRMCKVLLT